jgi:GlpG protein
MTFQPDARQESAAPAETRRTRAASPKLKQIPVTAAIIVICTLVAVLTRVGMDVEAVGRLTWARPEDLAGGRDALAAIRDGELYRVLTPILVHFGPIHALFNLMWVKDLGSVIERVFGSFYLLAMVATAGVLSNTMQFVVGGPSLFGGMSGVLYGLFGFLWVREHFSRSVPYHIPRSTVGILLVWLVVCFTGIVGPVANFAHLGGLIVGAAWGAISAFAPSRR